ncbi:MAG: sugar-binding domain-containing protein, partial [Clostridia bacterium]
MNRIHQKFNDDWKFRKGDTLIHYAIKAGETGGFTDCREKGYGEWNEIAYSDKSERAEINEKEWQSVTLPHDWIVYGDFSKEEWDAQGYLPTGVGCYRKVFTIPAEMEGRHIEIEFDGVSRNSTLWLNGHLIGNHFSGYTSFSYDITDYLRYGDEGENVLFMKVDAREFEGWWYEGAGIYRHVWLTITDQLRIEKWGTYITSQVSENSAEVKIETTIVNHGPLPDAGELLTEILDPNGNKVGEIKSAFDVEGSDKITVVQRVTVENPMLWDTENPNLYKALSTILWDEEVVDNYETTFGIRTIYYDKNGFFLNGKKVIFKGTCNHQDFAGIGSALPDSINEYKIQCLKEMGSNAYRSSHHPATESLLDACDRLGMLVMDENRKLDSSPRGIEDLKTMLYRDRNHPSIVIW